jgi:hypothetical protein
VKVYKDMKLIIKGKEGKLRNCHFGSNKNGKEGNIKFRKLGNGGNIIRERGEFMVKSEVNLVKNLQLRTF